MPFFSELYFFILRDVSFQNLCMIFCNHNNYYILTYNLSFYRMIKCCCLSYPIPYLSSIIDLKLFLSCLISYFLLIDAGASHVYKKKKKTFQSIASIPASMIFFSFFILTAFSYGSIVGFWCLMPLSTISVVSWRSVLLVEESRVPRENHWPASSDWQTLSHNAIPFVIDFVPELIPLV